MSKPQWTPLAQVSANSWCDEESAFSVVRRAPRQVHPHIIFTRIRRLPLGPGFSCSAVRFLDNASLLNPRFAVDLRSDQSQYMECRDQFANGSVWCAERGLVVRILLCRVPNDKIEPDVE